MILPFLGAGCFFLLVFDVFLWVFSKKAFLSVFDFVEHEPCCSSFILGFWVLLKGLVGVSFFLGF